MNTDWKKMAVGFSSICVLCGVLFFAFSSYYYSKKDIEDARKELPQISFDEHTLEAKAALIYDPKTQRILFAKNPQLQLPLASLTKLATAYAVLSARGRDQLVVINNEHLATEGDSHLKSGDVWRLADLIAFGLTTSSNDAMAAVASAISKETVTTRMNEEAAHLGLSQSYFLNETGLDVSSSTAGAYGSALDVARLMADLMKDYPDIFEATAYAPRPQAGSGEGTPSTLMPLWDVPGLIGAKTGFTDLAGGNLAAAVDLGLGEPVIAVVLGSTVDGRFTDLKALIAAARDARAASLQATQ